MATLAFHPMTTRYDPVNALALGQVAKLAYGEYLAGLAKELQPV